MISSNSLDRSIRADRAERITSSIARWLSHELDSMKRILAGHGDSGLIDIINTEMNLHLESIRDLIEDGQILPQYGLRLSQDAPHLSTCDKALRVGVFPTAADPFHWMHLLSGLKVMALFKLDKIIYVINGGDSRKPGLLRADIRHRIGQVMLRHFSPLFAYTPIALGNALDGEANIFRILQLNPTQKVDSFYIAGTDHYNRCNPETGKPDTIQKLENGIRGEIFGYDRRMNSISAIFLGRGARTLNAVDTFLNTEYVQRMPIEASSTAIRNALAGRATFEKLATLPYSIFAQIRKLALYSPFSRNLDGAFQVAEA
jgi:hypothetical protein